MKIALFADGTGNSASGPNKTNVWRAYQALDKTPHGGQCGFYDNGVGTSAFRPTAVLGLAFGWGLARNVRELYGFLVRKYEEGDEIYCFGFSRGAYTIRVLVGLICSQGIIDRNIARDEKDLDRLIAEAYRRFRREEFTPSLLSYPYRAWQVYVSPSWSKLRGRKHYDPRKNLAYGRENDGLIRFLGIWDTVGAYGGPVAELTRAWDRVIWPLTARDRNLSSRVHRACHALALDEQRQSFTPTLWNERGMPIGSRIDEERISQVWFAGVHSNVGGSYPDDALSHVALNWMLDRCEKQGLRFLPQERRRLRDAADVNGRIYDSRAGIGNLYRYAPRDLVRLCRDSTPGLTNWLKQGLRRGHVLENRVEIQKPRIHHSVFDRLVTGGDAYSPINIPADYAVVDPQDRIIDIRAPRPGDGESSSYQLPETSAQAQKRVEQQTLAWNKVWVLKVMHFLALVALGGFLAFPYFGDLLGGGGSGDLMRFVESLFGTLGIAIRAIPALVGQIPGLGFAGDWAVRYEPFPFRFMFFVVVILGFFLAAWKINSSLKSEIRRHWRHVTLSGGESEVKAGDIRKRLSAFLNSDFYRVRIAHSANVTLEAIAVVFLLLALLAVASRLIFVVVDGFGGVCAPASDRTALGKPFIFDPASTCFATGVKLESGKPYTIDIRIEGWRDGAPKGDADGEWIDADVDGWRSEGTIEGVHAAPWYLYLATPFRRHLLVDWYRIVARVDDKLFDRHPLQSNSQDRGDGVDPRQTKQGRTTLRTTFTPRRTGELYLYVNDALLFTPSVLPGLYANNAGRALVVVEEVTD